MSSNSKNKQNNTLLHEYAIDGNSIGIKSRLDLDVYLAENARLDIDAQNKQGKTPLHLAAYNGRVETVKTLILYGAKIDERDNTGKTPLHLAAYTGHVETVKTLIESGAKIDERDNTGKTPLHLAAYTGHVETVKTLIESGAKINEQDNEGKTPFLLMISYDKIPKTSKYEISKLLLPADANIMAVGNNGRRVYSNKGFENVKNTSSKNKSKRDKKEKTSSEKRRGKHYMPTIEENEEYKTKSPSPKLASIERIIRNDPSMINDKFNGKTALHYAVEAMDIKTVKELIEHGADVNARDAASQTPEDYITDLYKDDKNNSNLFKMASIQILLNPYKSPPKNRLTIEVDDKYSTNQDEVDVAEMYSANFSKKLNNSAKKGGKRTRHRKHRRTRNTKRR